MKKPIILLAMMHLVLFGAFAGKTHEPSDLFKSIGKNEKAAILMVHFGTTHDDTRALTIDAINQKVKTHFPDVDIYEAYTSRIIIKRLHHRGVKKQNPEEVLKKLRADGFTHILVQPTIIINGVEMESLNRNIDALRGEFKEIRVGTPLLFYAEDYEKIVDIITRNNNPEVAHLLVGHGTYDAATAQYAMLDYMLKERGYPNFIVGCVEGYPFYEQALRQLQSVGLKQVKLIPFMFVAGEHAKNDIAGDWKSDLEEAGFDVEVELRGLGEIPEIQDRFIEILTFNANNRRLDIMDKKKMYEVTGKKMKAEK